MARYERNIDELVKLAVDIANELTQLDARTWTIERTPHGNGVDLVSTKDTTRLYVHFDWQVDGRLRITPDNDDLREFAWYDDPKLGINVTQARGGHAIAKDIERRLLDDARDLRLKMLARKQAHDTHEGKVVRLARRMAAAAKQSAPTKNDRSGRYGFQMLRRDRHRQWYAPNATVEVSVDTDSQKNEYECVKIELDNLTPEMAERVLRLAAGFFE